MFRNKTLLIVFCVVMVDMLGVGILLPIIPLLLTDPSYPSHLNVPLSQGYVLLGWLTAIYPLMQFVATPILGQISDRIGRKPVLAFSLAGTSLSYIIFAIGILTRNVPVLFLSRALDGITGGNVSVAQAAIADSAAPENRAKSFGIIGAAFGIGFIVGPFLGGVLSSPKFLPFFNAATPFWVAAFLSFCNMLAVAFFFNETLKQKASETIHWLQSLINIKAAFSIPQLRALFASSFLFQAGFSFFTTFFGVYLIRRFGFDERGIGYYFAYIGFLVALTQGFITGLAGKRFSPFAIVATAFFGISATLAAFFFAPAAWILYLITIPNSMFVGLAMANLTALVSGSADPKSQGRVLGINASVQALAQSIPPIISGYAAASLNETAPLAIASAVVFLGGVVFVLFYRKHAGVALTQSAAA